MGRDTLIVAEAAQARGAVSLLRAVPRLLLLALTVMLAVRIGWHAALPPRVVPASAPATVFSAERAMRDVRMIGIRPHPTGSADNLRVSAYLAHRLAQLGLQVETRNYLIDDEGLATLRRWRGSDSHVSERTNLIGIMSGRDRAAPAVVLTAHYDTVWGSPGAAGDGAGVAAALEIARAIRAKGMPERDLILLLTDGAEIGSARARSFWRDGLPRHAGAVVDLEARGGGGRTLLSETGAGNGSTVAFFGGAVPVPLTNSLAMLLYRAAPKQTDSTPLQWRAVPGYDLALLGRPWLYHSPLATIDRLDPASLQDLGAQGLTIVSALASARALPKPSADTVFFDILGGRLIHYAPGRGWLILLAVAIALGLTCYGLTRRGAMQMPEVGGGLLAGLWLVVHAALGMIVCNLLSGSAGSSDYHARLTALPMLEAQGVLVNLAALAGFMLLRASQPRWLGALPALLLMVLGLGLGGPYGCILMLGLAGAILSIAAPRAGSTIWGGWIGAVLLLLIGAIVLQMAAPTAAWVYAWPALVLGLMMVIVAMVDRRFDRGVGHLVAAGTAVVVSAPVLPLGHLAFLSVGADRPEILLLGVPTIGAALWPLAHARASRVMLLLVACALIAAGTLAIRVRVGPPAAEGVLVPLAG